ncbi:heterokaryon incompatibility protein-domain-containing protein [Cercophora samala]|uniref:Heterokaryon incompatibility protein-domain-containing protein n=1 Tax=Cercophora samala TaxID=330535 RepID=A0AA40D6I5_9PEZI|nr:heterokaryon incompatibility protein-domain-containing protein [Cercophora samala]
MDAPPHAVYQPLDSSRNEIRLLSITGEVEGRLTCHLETVSLTENTPSFTALSYVWGHLQLTDGIILEGIKVSITSSLNAALKSVTRHWQAEFRDRDPATLRLWADGICINQRDNDERASQVQLMATLYASAELVIGWLGTTEPGRVAKALECVADIGPWFHSMKAMRPAGEWEGQITEKDLAWLNFLFPHLCDLEPVDAEHPAAGPGNTTWSAICFLLDLPYWHRIWIFQEAVLADRLLLASPSAATPYTMLEHIADAVRQIDRWWVGHAPSFIHPRIWRTMFRSPPRWEKVYIIQHARNRRLAFGDTSQALGLPENARTTVYDLAYAAAKLQATNKKDYVYGMLGVTGLSINPDYSDDKPYYGPWMEWVKAWTKLPAPSTPDPQFCELKFLFMAGVGFFDYPSGCSTWVPHFSGIAEKPPGTPPWLLGKADSSFEPGPALLELGDGWLRVSGQAVQRISRVVSLPLPDSTNPERSLPLNSSGISTALMLFIGQFVSQNCQHPSGTPPLLALTRVFLCDFATPLSDVLFFKGYRTMLAILISAWATTQPTYPTDFSNLDGFLAEKLGEPESTFNTIEWVLRNLWTSSEARQTKFEPKLEWFKLSWDDSDHILGSLGEIGYLIEGMVPFETDDGHLGMCPRGAQAGDLVCVLHGSSVPIILRPVGGPSTQYHHVGLCSLLGFMNGETHPSDLRRFVIV